MHYTAQVSSPTNFSSNVKVYTTIKVKVYMPVSAGVTGILTRILATQFVSH